MTQSAETSVSTHIRFLLGLAVWLACVWWGWQAGGGTGLRHLVPESEGQGGRLMLCSFFLYMLLAIPLLIPAHASVRSFAADLLGCLLPGSVFLLFFFVCVRLQMPQPWGPFGRAFLQLLLFTIVYAVFWKTCASFYYPLVCLTIAFAPFVAYLQEEMALSYGLIRPADAFSWAWLSPLYWLSQPQAGANAWVCAGSYCAGSGAVALFSRVFSGTGEGAAAD